MTLISLTAITAVAIPVADLASNLPILAAWFSPERAGWLIVVLGAALVGYGVRSTRPQSAPLDKDAIKRILRAARAAHVVQGGRRSSGSNAL